ncbi:MAG: VPS10 domain-containing protein [Mariniblastus sp.]
MVFSLNHLRVAFLSTLAVIFLSTLSYAQNEAGSGDRGRSSAEGTERGASERGRGGRRPRGGAEGRGAMNRGPRTEPADPEKPQVDQTKTPAKEEPKPAPETKKKLPPTLAQSVADQFSWRSIGPANMGGRITAIAVSEKDPSTWWAATASGGLLKTTNDGNTFEHQFDKEATVSIGDVQVSASNPDIVWVGTGESNPRNSVSWGDGVYKSVDGGKTWKNMGLKDTFQTGALAIHPKNPDVVWVGSLGRLWGPNPERGLFKTIDGGKTWKKVLFVNDTTGVIDVQLNPKNPDHLLVATYERKRDGFDGNDPEQRFGAGAGIYKSTDGGESFERVTEGLPTCKMGRIGLDFYEKDPKYVVAIVESEKIAKEPENYSFAGIRGEDAELGAKIVSVTKDGPSDKAGLKVGDIVASIDGRVVPSYSEMLKEIHKRPAGKTVKLVVSRERKLVDLSLELGKKPEAKGSSSSRNRRNDFTGTLGGQAANLQDTQGPEGYEYGGIYLSKDGGTSWSRINSLNPRPMYYSNIQVDPLDRNNIYVCGTSLYRSSDGGETFTGDGGSDGIHVDHHALWIDNKDPRHMILGNDGGVHVTRDRMEHWDHYNHVAIGQFYHASVDSNLDFNVYGGLQDNGSWGGPSRGKDGSGPINSDWIRVGGGDGFVTLSDPNDPKQIYFESQNGGMGRIHLETGARGFIRPRERGVKFRFNWKTPFILSPHNSQIHYSAGNYVLRSLKKGDGVKRISPEITNTDRGAGSAISESPAEEGVIYVGTTDGAVWMTKDGGKKWEPLFFQPEEKAKEKPAAKTPPKKAETDGKPAGDAKADVVSGDWQGRMISDRIPEDRAEFNFTLKLTDGKISGEVDGFRGAQEISEGTYNASNGALTFVVESQRGSRDYSGTIKNGKFTGEMTAGGGQFQMEIEATRKKKDPGLGMQLGPVSLLTAGIQYSGESSRLVGGFKFDDPVSGEWDCVIEDDNVPEGRLEFTLVLTQNKAGKVTGQVSSQMGDSEIVDAVFNEKTKRLLISASNEQLDLEFKGTVSGNEITGSVEVNGGELELEFVGERAAPSEEMKTEKKAEKAKAEKAKAEKAKAEKAKAEKAKAEKAKAEKAKQKKTAADAAKNADAKKSDKGESKSADSKKMDSEKRQENQSEAKAADDAVSGLWTGLLMSPNGEQDFTVTLARKSNTEITGVFESSRGEREINSGSFDPETKQLTLVADGDELTLELAGTVNGSKYAGEVDINGGSFTMDFELSKTMTGQPVVETSEEVGQKTAAAKVSGEEPKKAVGPVGEKSLSSHMPGPRWVSSIEASRFKKERCYITMDGHRSNDDGVYVFVTNDYGKTWDSLTDNLPGTAGSARVLREDIVNENLLLLGCEFSSWYSIDQGQTWTRIKGGLPTVSVHEFAIHPTAGEVVAATHGRSLWVGDLSVLRQLSVDSLKENSKLYDVKDAVVWQREPSRGLSGTRRFVGTNPEQGTVVAYSLGKTARQVELEIHDLKGETVKTFEAPKTKGLHMLQWDLRRDSGGRFRSSANSGTYLVRLKVDGELHQTTVTVKTDPSLSPAAASVLENETEDLSSLLFDLDD